MGHLKLFTMLDRNHTLETRVVKCIPKARYPNYLGHNKHASSKNVNAGTDGGSSKAICLSPFKATV